MEQTQYIWRILYSLEIFYNITNWEEHLRSNAQNMISVWGGKEFISNKKKGLGAKYQNINNNYLRTVRLWKFLIFFFILFLFSKFQQYTYDFPNQNINNIYLRNTFERFNQHCFRLGTQKIFSFALTDILAYPSLWILLVQINSAFTMT